MTLKATPNPELESVAQLFVTWYGYVPRPALDELDKLLQLDEIRLKASDDPDLHSAVALILWKHYPDKFRCITVAEAILNLFSPKRILL